MIRHIGLMLVLTMTPLLAQNADLSSVAVSEAIEAGRQRKDWSVKAGHYFGILNKSYNVYIEGPLAQIVRASREAQAKLLTFTPADVRQEMMTRFVVRVVPNKPYASRSGVSVPPAITHVALRVLSSGAAIQPLSLEPFSEDWGNALGGQFKTQGAVAIFDASQVPHQAFDVVAVTGGGDQAKFDIGEKTAAKIR